MRQMIGRLFLAAFVLALASVHLPTLAQGQDGTAGILLSQCTNSVLSARETCATFILQSIARNRTAPEPAYCLPASAILGDLRARFIAWGQTQTPPALGAPADDGLATALAEAFPCPLTQSG
jgi:hypothetical protein